MTYLEGRNVVIEALLAKREIGEIFIEMGAGGDKVEHIISLSKKSKIPLRRVNKSFIKRKSHTQNSQGVIALASKIPTLSLSRVYDSLAPKGIIPFFILLKEVTYEQNLGAVLRTALGAGASGVVLSPRYCHLTPLVERTSMGASNYLPLIREGFFSALKFFKTKSFRVFSVENTGESPYFEEDLTGPLALVFGGENVTLSKEIIERCDGVVRIPMNKGLQSLNLSASVAVVSYERLRQEKWKKD